MVTTDGGLLLRAILADPEDDTVRLIYADWLDEIGEAERAEFIRVQCQLARETPCGVCGGTGWFIPVPGDGNSVRCRICEEDPPRRLERELFDSLWLALASAAFPSIDPTGRYPESGRTRVRLRRDEQYDHDLVIEFRRGFVGAVTIPLADFTEDAARAVFAAHPVTAVRLSDREPVQVRDESRTYPEWRWFRHEPAEHPFPPAGGSDLPDRIFRRLDGGTLNAGGWCHFYPTRELALRALSAAAVDWARGLVGLTARPGR